MIDRVTASVGRLGPVGDAEAMAANILAVWNSDRAAIGAAARDHALQFSWQTSMEALFGEVYPAALARRGEVSLGASAAAALAA